MFPLIPLHEARPWEGFYKCRLLKVVDGDTMDLDVDVGLDTHVYVRVRLVCADLGPFDTPEVRGEERPRGLAAKEHAASLLAPGQNLRLRTGRGEARGKYGRWIGALYYPTTQGWQSLAEKLTELGHAK